jgi:hypothetical protein
MPNPHQMFIDSAMEFVKFSCIEGDYLEFGVFTGGAFVRAFHSAQAHSLKSMRFYAFDSFAGLPKVEGIDSNYGEFKEGDYACDITDFKKNIIASKVDLEKVDIIQGWYNEILNAETKRKIPLKKAAIIWIDCDLYKSTVDILEFITDYVQEGTVLVFDDWFHFKGSPNAGEQKAFREWLGKNNTIGAAEYLKISWKSNSFILYKK